ncbi:MAG: histidine phosphatase family protein [Ectothiorhodospiraceae bacterium]|nr:histidine phosphatase family protein [Ectothiorhodospiraceae bacterium]
MQRVVLVRHGPAEDAGDGVTDMARGLTDKGRQKTRKAARGLAAVLGSVDLLAASPYIRALQTADILDEHLHANRRLELSCLVPGGSPAEALDRVAQEDAELVVLVGHEPHLSLLAGLAMTGESRRMLAFRKAGAAMLEFPVRARAGEGLLHWLFSPSQLGRHPIDSAD